MEPRLTWLVCAVVLTAVFIGPANLAPTHSAKVERRSTTADSELVQLLKMIVGRPLTDAQESQIEALLRSKSYGCNAGGCSSTELAEVGLYT